MSTLQRCIRPNPDIAGVGVRFSIYIQCLISLAPSVLAAADGKVTNQEGEFIRTIHTNLLLTGYALIISAYIQMGTIGLSVYHALIVLNMGWMVNASALMGIAFPIIRDVCVGNYAFWRTTMSSWKRSQPVLLDAIHLSLVSYFGVHVWKNIDTFGDQPDCTLATFVTIFSHDISVKNKQLRTASLILYAITVSPILNIALLMGLMIISVRILTFVLMRIVQPALTASWTHEFYSFRPLYYSAVLIVMFINIFFIIDTELMIRRSQPYVLDGESQWTFGQTLSMLFLVFPAFETQKAGVKWFLQEQRRRMQGVDEESFQGLQDGGSTQLIRFHSGKNQALLASAQRANAALEVVHATHTPGLECSHRVETTTRTLKDHDFSPCSNTPELYTPFCSARDMTINSNLVRVRATLETGGSLPAPTLPRNIPVAHLAHAAVNATLTQTTSAKAEVPLSDHMIEEPVTEPPMDVKHRRRDSASSI